MAHGGATGITMTPIELQDKLKPMLLKDLRTQCRVRDLNPAGGLEALRERLTENMLQTHNYNIVEADGSSHVVGETALHSSTAPGNNYARPDGQNVGNFMTDRNSSRVLAPPGGASQISFGSEAPAGQHQQRAPAPPGGASQINFGYEAPAGHQQQHSRAPPAPPGGASQISFGSDMPASQQYARNPAPGPAPSPSVPGSRTADGPTGNNYHRPGGQNVGNFLTDRNSSRVLAPPGGASQISFG